MSLRNALLSLSVLALAACDAGDAASAGADAAAASPEVAQFSAVAREASAVFVGHVIAIEPRLSEPTDDGRVVPFHFVTWEVEEAAFGVEAGATFTGRFAGGALPDGRTLWVSEVPEFALGQRALVAATEGDRGACALVGCREGMLVLEGEGDPLDAVAQGLLAELADPSAPLARSADPDAPFAFLGRPRTATDGLDAARARAAEQLARPAPVSPRQDPRELEALSGNDWNPVLSR